MRGHVIGLLVFSIIAWLAAIPAAGAGNDAARENSAGEAGEARAVDFGREIQPLLARRCFACHGPDKNEGGLRLNRRETALGEIDSGNRAVVPGKPDASALIERIRETDESLRMPPEGEPLSPKEIELFRRWIAAGAEWEQHWAFVPAKRQAIPAVQNTKWVRNAVDAFILARLEAAGLEPAPPADKPALLRRVYFDLVGLPPALDEVEAFVADESPNAYEQVVDRLLASPHYGEKWGRHWLDLVRYAETNSYERDGLKPNAWRYRDYVIRSFNADKPYDRFILEQLAGDELPDADRGTIIATGYYRLGLWDDEPVDPVQAYYDEMDDIVRTTGEVFLGLTIGCARCHDHKIDPIPQSDYYRMLAFFHDLDTYGVRSDQLSNNQTDISPPELAAAHQELARKKGALREQMLTIEQAAIVKMPAPDQRKTEGPEREQVLAATLHEYLSAEQSEQYRTLKQSFEELERVKLPPREMALSVNKNRVPPPPTHVLLRGNAHAHGDRVEPGYPTLFSMPDPQIPPAPEGAGAAGRRIVLARWIASPENMLTARVLANRLWQFHFGRGLVRSSNNFGQLGDRPTHPALLDWLASELADVPGSPRVATRGLGWSLKRMHRLLVTSSAYRMSSQGDAAGLARDPANDLFWRFDMRRLTAEEIRDAIYAVNGRFHQKMYGPSIYPELSQEVLAGQSRPGEGWGKSSPRERARRSVYIHIKRSLVPPMLSNFDFADTDSSCAARFITTQPAQALGLINGDFAHEQARQFAARLRDEAGDEREAQVHRALWLALAHEPDEDSLRRSVQLIETLETEHGLLPQRALDYFCLVVLNLNEFVYLD